MTGANMFQEKRIYPRFPAEFQVKYRLIEEGVPAESIADLHKREINTQTQDISLGGMFIVANQRLDIGGILTFRCIFPRNLGSFSAFGEVVWVNGQGGGVHFLALKESDMNSLKAVLEKYSSLV